MRSFAIFTSLALLLTPVFSAPFIPSKIEVERITGNKKDGSYIVKLKDGTDKKEAMAWIRSHLGSSSSIKYDYDDDDLNGFSGTFSQDFIDILTNSDKIEAVSEDAMVYTNTVQKNAPWGLQRITQKKKLSKDDTDALNYKYSYDGKAGEGVDVYVVDTGIHVKHKEFEGRAKWSFSAFEGLDDDGNGHGTHCAGTIGGKTFGVAKKVKLFAVKVLDDEGSGTSSSVVAGINFVIKEVKKTKRPSVISMSLGGGRDRAIDRAVKAAIKRGVHVIVAAGNSDEDADYFSPARVEEAITVGAMDIHDVRAPFSNFGDVVDVFAPGVDIISAWIGSKDATNILSGTSMATPHVSGLAAYLLSIHGSKSPEALAKMIKNLAVKKVISDIPEDTPNLLIQNH
ncbi:subtilisin-like serine protease [Tulasnella sp. 418]|nr:subtilisin-like serine protease [Tulasnella sp. 418]